MPPSNDDFANAQLLTGASGSVQGDNTGATTQAADPLCASIGYGGGANVWFKWVAPSDGLLTVRTDPPSSGTPIFDTILAVLSGASYGSLVVLGADDDDHGPFYSQVSDVPIAAGETIYIEVDGYSGDDCGALNPADAAQGRFTLAWTFTATAPPETADNTTCAAAHTISGTSGTRLADNSLANGWTAPDPIFSDPTWGLGEGGGGPLWWKYTNARAKPVLLRIFIEPGGSDTIERALVGIFRGECGSLQADDCQTTWGFSGTCFGLVDDVPVPGGSFDFVDAIVHPGETVHIEVDGYSGDTSQPPTLGEPNRGRFKLRWEVRTVSDPGNAAFDGVEEAEENPDNENSGCGGTYSEASSRLGGPQANRQCRSARSDDYLEFLGDSWYTAALFSDIGPIVDDFNRPDANPLNGSWITPFLTSFGGSAAAKLVGNEAFGTVAGLSTAGWNTSLGANQEVSAEVGVDGTTSRFYRLFLRMDAGGSTGYMVRFGGADNSIVISRLDGGGGAVALSSAIPYVPHAGDRIRFRASGTTLHADVLFSGQISWHTLVSVSSSTYNRAGYVAIGIVTTTGALDNFEATGGTLPGDFPKAKVHRWNGSAVTEYDLPILGTWMQNEIQLNSDGATLWAVTTENGNNTLANPKFGSEVGAPAHWAPAYPVVFAYNAGSDSFVRVGTMTPRAANVQGVGVDGPVGLGGGTEGIGLVGGIDSTAHSSMPGRLYVVWSEKGMNGIPVHSRFNISPPGATQHWIEHLAIGCFGPGAPFAEFDIGYSDTPYGDACDNFNGIDGETGIGDVPFWTPTGRTVVVNDQGVCQLFRIEPQNPHGFANPDSTVYQKGYVRCEQVEDGGSLTLKRIVNYQIPPGLPPDSWAFGDQGQATHLSVEPICHTESGGGVPLQGDSWVFVVQASDFPGDHPDYDFLIANGVSGVLWRSDTDPNCAAGMASTRAAGLQAGIWLVAANDEDAVAFANRASSDVNTFHPDICVLDCEVVAKGFAPDDPGWLWSETMMQQYRTVQPSQTTAVTMLPLQDDFNYAAYTSRACGIWPQSYGTTIGPDDIDPMDVINRVIANGVDPSAVKAVLPYDVWAADVEELRANGIYTFAVFTAEGMQAVGGGVPPDTPSPSPTTAAARTAFIGWQPTGSPGFAFAYNLDPLLAAPERWYNENVQHNGNDVLLLDLDWSTFLGDEFYANEPTRGGGGARKAIHFDRYDQHWALNGQRHKAVWFDRKCNQVWESGNLPSEADSEFITLGFDHFLNFMACGRQMVFDEPSDVIRSSTWYQRTPDHSEVNYYEWLAVSHMHILRNWIICVCNGSIITASGTPDLVMSFRAKRSSSTPADIAAQPPAILSGISFRAKKSSSPSGTGDAVHLSGIRFRT